MITGQKARAVRHVTRWVLTPPLERADARIESSKYIDKRIQNQADEQNQIADKIVANDWLTELACQGKNRGVHQSVILEHFNPFSIYSPSEVGCR